MCEELRAKICLRNEKREKGRKTKEKVRTGKKEVEVKKNRMKMGEKAKGKKVRIRVNLPNMTNFGIREKEKRRKRE